MYADTHRISYTEREKERYMYREREREMRGHYYIMLHHYCPDNNDSILVLIAKSDRH